jgi:MFS transporter, ACS family, allantoate permease
LQKPRNHVPWTVVACSFGASAVLLIAIRFVLVAENRKRDREASDSGHHDAYVVETKADGTQVERKIDQVRYWSLWLAVILIAFQAFLDLTDRENRDFRYVL